VPCGAARKLVRRKITSVAWRVLSFVASSIKKLPVRRYDERTLAG